MGVLLEVFKDGEKFIRLTNHSIKDVFFNSEKATDISPKLHTITKNLVIEGLINTDLVDEEPKPLTDDYGAPVLDEDGEQQYELLEIDSVRQLTNWAIVPEYCEPYCDVSVTLTDAGGDLIKTEEFENMFVVGFEEEFDDRHGNGIFTVYLRERAPAK